MEEKIKGLLDAFSYVWKEKKETMRSLRNTLHNMEDKVAMDLDMLMMKLLKVVPNNDKVEYVYNLPTDKVIYLSLNNGDVMPINTIVSLNHCIYVKYRKTPYNLVKKEQVYEWSELTTNGKIGIYTCFLSYIKEDFENGNLL